MREWPSIAPLVLVVDDNDDVRDMFARYLCFHGLRVAQATSGEQAVEMALALGPDVIVMDLGMPGIGGCEAARRLTGSPLAAGMAVIGFSADDSASSREQARDAGCCEFVAKPCAPERLLSTVLAACRSKEEQVDAPSTSRSAGAGEEPRIRARHEPS